MLIKDICRECKLTKKAVEYYEQQGLISPAIMGNGYRNYSLDDISKLKEISVLRKLNIGVADIKDIITSANKAAAIAKCKYKMELELQKSMTKVKCLEQLANNYDINRAISYINENVDKHFTIKEKLLQAFPGTYGIYLCIHFGQFLNERIDTEEKEEAYYKIVNYLDRIERIELPSELEEYLLQDFAMIEQASLKRIDTSILEAVDNIDAYLEKNKENIEEYLKYRNSEEFKNSLIFKKQQLLLRFQQSNGYYDVLIPNMKVLSDSYRRYSEKLAAANKAFADKYPDVKEIQRL